MPQMMEREIRGSGRPLVLVPGGLTGSRSWIPHAEILNNKYQTIRVQLEAVRLGLTGEPLPPDYSLAYERDLLARTLKEFEAPFDIAAWSYGAAISLSYAIHNPERVRSLTLIEPPAIWVLRSRGPLSEEMQQHQEAITKLGPGEITEDQLVWFSHFAGFVPWQTDPRQLAPWPMWYEHRNSLRTQDVVYRHEDEIERVRAFDRPVLLVKGKGSAPFLHEIIDILSESFPKNERELYPGGHAPHIVAMQPFLDRFTVFLEAH